MKYRIKNGLLLLNDENGFLVKREDLFIDGQRIESIGDSKIVNPEIYTEINAHNQLIMPGLINSHTHAYMTFMKNSADDLPLYQWLQKRIFPIESRMQKEDFYWATLFGCVEMIKSGTTCFLDMHICENECAKALQHAGVRAFIGKCLTGDDLYSDALQDFENAMNEADEYASDLLQFVLSPHSVYACSKQLLSQIADVASERGMIKHIHLSESKKELDDCLSIHGISPVALLQDIGFLDHKTIAAHCVKLNEDDIRILSENKVNVATNPSSNAKLGNGIAPISEMMKRKINICLGTDSAASNNTLNMFREMSIFSLLHKAVNESPSDFSASTVLQCVTLNPAIALDMQDKIGSIKEGACADLVFIDLNSISLFPNNDIIAALSCSANGSEVRSVMINGQFVMQNGIIMTLDTERIYYEAKLISEKYL